jgi:transglutaminase-like putative cysteine protease
MSASPPGPGTPPAPRLLRVRHETRYRYDEPVTVAHHLAHLRPRDTDWQRISGWALQIDPPPDAAGDALTGDASARPGSAVQASVDGFGNWRHAFSHARVHEQLQVVSSFDACLQAPAPLQPQASPPWEQVAAQLRYRAGSAMPEAAEFALGSPLAPRGEAFARLAGELFAPHRPLLEAALALMAQVHDSFEYAPQTTQVSTSAAEALAARRGVCQDFAHVAIAALRSLGLAARYVSGYLLTQPPPGQPRLVGADASHAWFAVWCPLHGWVALDPTNRVRAGQDHVTVAWGRDYEDVAPLRGVILGGGQAAPEVAVTVQPVPGAAA